MNLKNMLPIWGVLVLLFAVSTGSAFAFSVQAPPAEKTGAPNESTCMDCHVGNELNASDGSLMLTIPETYIPNEVYTIVVNLSREGQSRWGFEMTALDADGGSAGSFIVDDAGNTGIFEANSKKYIHHTTAGTAAGTNDANSWEFQWTAPDADMGPVTFYAAGNAANGDFNTTGDYIYTTQSESASVVGGVSLEIVGEASLSTVDAVAGVSYTLKVTNTGNAMDTIMLEASALVGIATQVGESGEDLAADLNGDGVVNALDLVLAASSSGSKGSMLGSLSKNSVELEAGASEEVTLVVAGDLFTTPGDYVIGVRAASGTDDTMTAETTTTTTIETPVIAGVSLEVVGDNALSTMDAVEGVSYTLKVTNTGNMMDTIALEASAEVGIEGSVLGTLNESSIELEADGSAEVTLKVSGDLLTEPGDYAISVTATSGTDSTMTAETTTTTTIEMPVIAGVSLEIVGDNALSTMDAVEGVSYTLKVTNTGNMMDTITLEASAEVGIEGSVLGSLSDSERSIELEAGAAAEVTLKVAGDLFTKPGDYPISVTATSKTDSTKTAEATTTTTIEPPPTPWDVNDDGTVDIRDLVLVAGQLGESGEGLKGDINGDGTVDIRDLVIVASHLGEDTSN